MASAFLHLYVVADLGRSLSARKFKWIFRLSAAIMAIDFVVLFIALPVGVSQNYGFQSAKWVFTETFNGTGASFGWAWCLSFLSTAYVLTGFDAAGELLRLGAQRRLSLTWRLLFTAHIAEETKNPSLTAARGVFWSCVSSAVLAFRELLRLASLR